MIYDATKSGDIVLFQCALEDYETDPIYKAVVKLYATTKYDDQGQVKEVFYIPKVEWLTEPSHWPSRLLNVLLPRIVDMLHGNGVIDLRSWMDEQVLEQIEMDSSDPMSVQFAYLPIA